MSATRSRGCWIITAMPRVHAPGAKPRGPGHRSAALADRRPKFACERLRTEVGETVLANQSSDSCPRHCSRTRNPRDAVTAPEGVVAHAPDQGRRCPGGAAWARMRRSAEAGPGRGRWVGAVAVSVEAISWALNLAPVLADRGGQPSSACKIVILGLANHARPDGAGVPVGGHASPLHGSVGADGPHLPGPTGSRRHHPPV